MAAVVVAREEEEEEAVVAGEGGAAAVAWAAGASSAAGPHQGLRLDPRLAVPLFVGPLLDLGIPAAPRAP